MLIKTERYIFIDYIRFIAILCVVLCHSVEAVYSFSTDYLSTISDVSNLFRLLAFTIGRTFGVPMFLMISGYLLLDRDYDTERVKKFYLNNWLHLVICTMFWFLIYDIFLKYYMRNDLSISVIVKDAFLLHKVGMGHQWYMPVIIGFYAMIPFISIMVKKEDLLKYLIIPYAIVFLYMSVFPSMNHLLQLHELESLDPRINRGFTGGIYGLFIVMGYIIKKGYLRRIKRWILVLLTVFSVVFLVFFYYKNYRNTYVLWYDSPFLIIASISFFEMASRVRKPKSNKLVFFLAEYSFAIYLIHYIIQYIKPVKIFMGAFIKPIQVIFFEIIMVLVSCLLAWLISRIPVAGKYLLYVK